MTLKSTEKDHKRSQTLMGIFGLLERSRECQRLCEDITWLNCGYLKLNAFNNTLQSNRTFAMALVGLVGIVLGLILSWVPNLVQYMFELKKKNKSSVTNELKTVSISAVMLSYFPTCLLTDLLYFLTFCNDNRYQLTWQS